MRLRLRTCVLCKCIGAPTLIVNHRAPTANSESIAGPFDSVVVSSPEQGKHIVFDGQLLHGVPAELSGWARNNHGGSGSCSEGGARADSSGKRSAASKAKATLTPRAGGGSAGGGSDNVNRSSGGTVGAQVSGRRRGCRQPQRLTFLVNVWLNHVPSTLELSQEALGWLSNVDIVSRIIA